MEDLDLKELSKNLVIWLIVTVVFGSMMTIVLVRKFGSQDISINKKIDEKKSMTVLIINNQTKNKKQIIDLLKEKDIKYEIINRDKERYFDSFLQKLSITEKDIIEPTILIIEKGEVKSILVNVNDLEELNTFLDYNS